MTETIRDTSTLSILLNYLNLGFALLPLWGVKDGVCRCRKGKDCDQSPGKHPRGDLVPSGVKGASRDPAIIRQWFKYAHVNWGVACGEALAGGGFLLCLDVDPRNGGLDTVKDYKIPATWTEVTGRGDGGTHYLFRSETPVPSHGLGPGLDVISTGKYFVVDPSVHPSGGVYSWELGKAPGDIPIAGAPEWLLDGGENKVRPVKDGFTARETVLGEAFRLHGTLGADLGNGTIAVACPWANEHTDARGRGQDSSTVILPPAGGSRFGGFKCCHAHCTKRKWSDVVNALPTHIVNAAREKYPMRPVDVNLLETVEPDGPNGEPSFERQLMEVRMRLHYKGKNRDKLASDLVNATTILNYDPRWKNILSWDAFSQDLRFTEPPPWHIDDAPSEDVATDTWTDVDANRLSNWFKRFWDMDLDATKSAQAAYLVANRQAVHPLRDWLSSLKWDGEPRAERWLTTYMGAEDAVYTRMVGLWWLVSAVARAFQPGIKVDHVLILEGPQGRGKSDALKALAGGPDWFSDSPLDIGNKDAFVALRGKWILELGELASLNSTSNDRAKAFFSAAVDSYRPPFGRSLINVPRSCVFAGTVNPDTYLTDETGNRRYWPVRCGTIDREAIWADRDQIWAEVVHLYNPDSPASTLGGARGRGQRWWPEGPQERMILEAEQATRECQDPLTEPIWMWVRGIDGQSVVRRQGYLTAHQIGERALKLEIIDRRVMNSITAVMTNALRWGKHREEIDGVAMWVFRPPLTVS